MYVNIDICNLYKGIVLGFKLQGSVKDLFHETDPGTDLGSKNTALIMGNSHEN